MGIVVVLDNIRSALNVGAILRTADGAGAEKLILCGITPEISHEKVKKTALGAEEYVKTVRYKDITNALSDLKNEGYTIYAIEQHKESILLNIASFSENSALIFGNEISGVSPEALNLSDAVIEIPMFGKKNSLNVATTVGIVLYSIRLKE